MGHDGWRWNDGWLVGLNILDSKQGGESVFAAPIFAEKWLVVYAGIRRLVYV